MKIAVASGKGGTGKTTISTNLAFIESQKGKQAVYVDCDVEEPNGHLFLKPEIHNSKAVGITVPLVNQNQCVHCGQCGEICHYSAIVCLGSKVLQFPEMCHSCGGCWLVCPQGAITKILREMGRVESGHAGSLFFVQGILHIGEAMSPPVIRAVKEAIPDADLVILDAPPGTSCPVIETLRGCDYVILVTEPTPFGLNDLKLAVETVRALRYPFGVVINRAEMGFLEVQEYCQHQGIPILVEIPDDRRIAEAYSTGQMICEAVPEYTHFFSDILPRVTKQIEDSLGGVS